MLVKVCGITTEEDGLMSVDAGADALGFNFYPPSPRYITPDAARAIVDRLPPGVLKVGIFVNEPLAHIAAVTEAAGLDVAQVHGAIDGIPANIRLWRALPAGTPLDGLEAEAFLLDTPSKSLPGGTGRTFDWSLAHHPSRRIIVAGGLDASNVRDAIRAASPWGVDACSRLESYPGRKDPEKVRQFIQAIRNL